MEKKYKDILKSSRKEDSFSGSSQIGAHKTKFIMKDLNKNSLAENNSTGEQKILLLNIIIAFVSLISTKNNTILLLDEMNVHLDGNNTKNIINRFLEFNTQIFITTTNEKDYKDYSNSFSYLNL